MARRTEGCFLVVLLISIGIAYVIIQNIRAGERAFQRGADRAADAVSDAGSRLSAAILRGRESMEEAGRNSDAVHEDD